jgi:hypothetical protein
MTHNRFFHGYCSNKGNAKSSFRYYIIESVREITDYNGGSVLETINKMEDFYFDDERIGDPFYGVYGSFKIDFKQSSMLITFSDSLERAIKLVENLTGNYVKETEQPIYRLPD